MYVLQRMKSFVFPFSKVQAVKLSLLIVLMLMLTLFVPLPGVQGVAHAASCPPSLSSSNGASGIWVHRLQGTLNFYSVWVKDLTKGPYHYNHPLAVDGSFGPQTTAAVKDYQHFKGLQVDGIVGPQTWGSLGFCSGSGHTGSISGGGCTTTTYVAACISVNVGRLWPNIYLRTTSSVFMDIALMRDGDYFDLELAPGPNPAGNLIYGPIGHPAASGHTWQTFTRGNTTDGRLWGAISPVQFT
jgi:hypothetical protein